jgi:hypothetical protein
MNSRSVASKHSLWMNMNWLGPTSCSILCRSLITRKKIKQRSWIMKTSWSQLSSWLMAYKCNHLINAICKYRFYATLKLNIVCHCLLTALAVWIKLVIYKTNCANLCFTKYVSLSMHTTQISGELHDIAKADDTAAELLWFEVFTQTQSTVKSLYWKCQIKIRSTRGSLLARRVDLVVSALDSRSGCLGSSLGHTSQYVKSLSEMLTQLRSGESSLKSLFRHWHSKWCMQQSST